MLSQLKRLRLARPLVVLIVVALDLLADAVSAPTSSLAGPVATSGHSALPSNAHEPTMQKRDDAPVDPLPPNHWELAGSDEDIEDFRLRHNLTLVSATPQDAALMPSWPQALFQYILVAPPINCAHTSSTSHTTTTNGVVTSHSENSRTITPFNFLQVVLSPFVFVAWCVSFGLTQSQKATGGWPSVLGWAAWFDLAHFLFGPFALPPLVFQWVASFTLIIQRWKGGLGAIAYHIDSLNGCIPADGEPGVSFLQQGARSRNFRIVQSVTFPVATLFMLLSAGSAEGFDESLGTLALAELIYTAVVASRGTPVVVSGNCMLVELNPSGGFLNSSINTRWKVFASFMGF